MSPRSPLIDVDELAELIQNVTAPSLVVLDVRWRLAGPTPAELYAPGHLPSAVAVDLDRDLADAVGDGRRGRHPLPDPDVFETTLRRWGIRADSTVVVYDDADGSSAARAWWLLRWAGLTDVRVLDGGIGAWLAAGQPLTTEVPEPAPGDVVVRPGDMPVLDADAAGALPGAGGVLLDARAEARYRGEVEPVDPVAGHIPDARSAPTSGNVEADGRFLAPEELRERFAALGVRPGKAVGAYCGSGVTASQEVLALEIAGVPAALYPGSWSEWVADRARPVETGPDGAA
ncbi:MAG TPA: sulfurtransferase [Mycobacteriales bacterium]|jgi:thiosulfate/3-mercaptopyruvate sulfurtransferase|nr:sulfurtransferase [Mycobacteriales bacterium]